MLHYVHKIDDFDDALAFTGKSGKEAAEKAVYYLGLDSKDQFAIHELRYGYVILVNGVETYWVQK